MSRTMSGIHEGIQEKEKNKLFMPGTAKLNSSKIQMRRLEPELCE